MKLLKILLVAALVVGLVVGIIPALAASDGDSSGTSTRIINDIGTDDSALCEPQQLEVWSEPSCMLENMVKLEWDEDILEWSATPAGKLGFKFHSGVVTNLLKDDAGNITRITILDRQAQLLTFNITSKTRFYYEEGIPQVVEEGSLVTIVCRPGVTPLPQPLLQKQALGRPEVIPLLERMNAVAVVVHAPRPSIIYGTVAGIDLENRTLSIETKAGNVTVKLNNETKYVFLPRPCNAELYEAEIDTEYQLESNIKRSGLEDIVVGDRVVVFAPKLEDGVRLAKLVVVLPKPQLERIAGAIVAIDEGNRTITLNVTKDEGVSPENVTFRYTTNTTFVLRGFIEVEVGQNAVAWCEKDSVGDLVARLVRVTLA